MPRLFIIIYSPLDSAGGGRETWLVSFLSHVRIREHYQRIDVAHIAGSDRPSVRSLLGSHDIRFHGVPLPDALPPLGKLVAFARACRAVLRGDVLAGDDGTIDVLAVGSFYESFSALWSASRTRPEERRRVRLFTWMRGIWVKEIGHRHGPGYVRAVGLLERLMLRRMDACIANGEDTATFYATQNGVPSRVIPNGIDLERFRSPVASLTADPLRVALVSRLAPEKGIDAFLEVVQRLAQPAPRGNPHIEFVIAGDGILRDRVVELAARHPVRYLGPIANDRIAAVLAEADVTLHLTTSGRIGGGGVSHALIESMAAGNVIVCWRNPIFAQVVSDDSAYLVPEGDARGLADAILSIDADREGARAKRARSLQLAAGYSFHRHVDRYLDFVGGHPAA